MLKLIDSQTKQERKEFETKNGKKMFRLKKRTIYIYAHNGARYDSYFYLNVPEVRCTQMIEKGGIMSMTIESDEFYNAKFVVRDTFKFLASGLSSLCKSYKIPEEYCKGEMNHDEVNANTWK
jgi:hypothetical protein